MSDEKSDTPKPPVGTIAWADLTAPNAEALRDFYADVVGWVPTGLDMGGYEDYVMSVPSTGEGVAGVCHARGPNAGLPPQWLIYVVVPNLDASIEAVTRHGGEVVAPVRAYGSNGRYAVVRDPSGAALALFENT